MKTTIKFMKSASLCYEMNGEVYYEIWFETSLEDIGINDTIIKHYGSLESVCQSIINEHPLFLKNGYDLYEIIAQ